MVVKLCVPIVFVQYLLEVHCGTCGMLSVVYYLAFTYNYRETFGNQHLASFMELWLIISLLDSLMCRYTDITFFALLAYLLAMLVHGRLFLSLHAKYTCHVLCC